MPATYSKTLVVHLDGRRIGTLHQESGGAVRFGYDEDYLRGDNPTPLSLSMPVTQAEHSPRVTRAYIAGLLPESAAALARWAQEFAVNPNNPFALLAHMGRDAAGAVQILPPDVEPSDAATRQGDVEWLTEEGFDRMVADLAAHWSTWDPGRFGGRWSLSGAQPKMALFHDPDTGRWAIPRDSTPTNVIVKPALRDHRGHHINETLCLHAAQNAGVPAANSSLLDIAGVEAMVSHRYDRARVGDRWVRLHQEDLCQALGVQPSLKYQADGGPGVPQIADLFARLDARDARATATSFFRALAFHTLIGGTDAHAKNYSVLLRGDRVRLAPLYDVASAACYDHWQSLVSPIRVGTADRMLNVPRSDWQQAGRRLGLGGDEALGIVDSLVESLPDAFAEAVASLPSSVRDTAATMAERIVEHVRGTWRPNLTRNPDEVLPRDTRVTE